MKKKLFFVLLLTVLLPLVYACINSADDYATEVLLNKPEISYNLQNIISSEKISFQGNQYFAVSQYSPNILAIFSEESGNLLVRLQALSSLEDQSRDFTTFVSSSAKGTLNISSGVYNGWNIDCARGSPPFQCEFKKDNLDIVANLVNNRYDINVDILESLQSCSSSCQRGQCISSSGESLCIPEQEKNDIYSILSHTSLVSDQQELYNSYRVVSLGKKDIQNIVPSVSLSGVNWQEAMKQELVQLKRNGALFIKDSNIEQISSIVIQGTAGVNKRIVYGTSKGIEDWGYYKDMDNALLTKITNCQDYPSSLVPTGNVISSGNSSVPLFYAIPLSITLTLAFIFLVLIFVARAINNSKEKTKNKKPKQEGSNPLPSSTL